MVGMSMCHKHIMYLAYRDFRFLQLSQYTVATSGVDQLPT